MSTTPAFLLRTRLGRLLTPVCLLLLGSALLPNLAGAADQAAVATPALTISFERTEATDTPPYVLKVTNASKQTLQLEGHVLLSVASHNQDRARPIPAQELAQGKSLTVDELAAHDRVVLRAEGFSALEIVVPQNK